MLWKWIADALIWTFMVVHHKKSNTATLPQESSTGFSILAGVPRHIFPPPRKPRNISFHPRGIPTDSAGFPRIPRDSRDPHPRASLYIIAPKPVWGPHGACLCGRRDITNGAAQSPSTAGSIKHSTTLNTVKQTQNCCTCNNYINVSEKC